MCRDILSLEFLFNIFNCWNFLVWYCPSILSFSVSCWNSSFLISFNIVNILFFSSSEKHLYCWSSLSRRQRSISVPVFVARLFPDPRKQIPGDLWIWWVRPTRSSTVTEKERAKGFGERVDSEFNDYSCVNTKSRKYTRVNVQIFESRLRIQL